MQQIEKIIIGFADVAWGPWLLVLLLGGGALFFSAIPGFCLFGSLGTLLTILRGKYDDPNDPGEISHFAALSSALAATIGVGNIAGVAVAVTVGGPGAIFWMWLSAIVGMATKFFTCTLAIMYRGTDSRGTTQGGPMYAIVEGLGKKWKPLRGFLLYSRSDRRFARVSSESTCSNTPRCYLCSKRLDRRVAVYL